MPAPQERRYPIFVTLERGLNVSVKGEHSTHSDSVTNIGYLLSLGAVQLYLQIQNLILEIF